MVCAGSIGWFHYHSDDVRTIMHHRKHRHLLEVEADDDVGIRADGVELTATSSERFRDADEDGNDEDETKQYMEDMRMNVLGSMM